MDRFELIVGLEIHIELSTKSKMFCRCSADYFGGNPNVNTCPVCLGMPGALPVPNRKAIDGVALFAKSLNFEIPELSTFERKHYFYPDLPKGYQISQFNRPIGQKGSLTLSTEKALSFRVQRVHLEEDAGKSIHEDNTSLIDYNRAGVPLMEIVTFPDFHNVNDIKSFLSELQTVVRYLGISNADLDKGSMRLEPNISLRDITTIPEGKLPPYKVEVKNINSFRFVELAINYEIERQKAILLEGGIPTQETRGFNESNNSTYSQRIKEDAEGYRYFPEPDIPPFELNKDFVDRLVLPELPFEKLNRYLNLGISYSPAYILTRDLALSNFFESVVEDANNDEKLKSIDGLNQKIANLIVNKKISTDLSHDEFIKKLKEELISEDVNEDEINKFILEVINENQKAVDEYKAGKESVIMFLIGQVMKKLKKKVDMEMLKNLIKKSLN